MFKIGDKVKYQIPDEEEFAEQSNEEDASPLSELDGLKGVITKIPNSSRDLFQVKFLDGRTEDLYECEIEMCNVARKAPSWL